MSKKEKPLIPAILLEGDAPPAIPAAPAGPGRRFEQGPSPIASAPIASAELPGAYGTGQLFLSARDPHWVYASWDLTEEQQNAHNLRARGGHLSLRVYAENSRAQASTEVEVHPESRSWFVFVNKADTKYFAELGYYGKTTDRWTRVALSRATVTPPDSMSEDTSARFSTIPQIISLPQVVEGVKELALSNPFVAEAVHQVKAVISHVTEVFTSPSGKGTATSDEVEVHAPAAPSKKQGERVPPARKTPFEWTVEKAQAIAENISFDPARRVWIGSLEITELLQRHLAKRISSVEAAEIAGAAGPLAPGLASAPSSLSAEMRPAKGESFWFNVNAELVLYGATESNAKVTIDGRPVRLRADGSFSFRFALPDGEYPLVIRAASGNNAETRQARLEFSRRTQYRGRVEAHPQESHLKPPRAENVER